MAKVRRYWSEVKYDLIEVIISEDSTMCCCDEFEFETVSCGDAIARLRAMGLDPVFYDEFDTWEEYNEYLYGGETA